MRDGVTTGGQQGRGRSINWVIKLSKLCNLRCGYCYEWNELGDSRRMSAELVERVIRAAADLHRLRLLSTPAARTTLIMHGGEPLVLPLNYLRMFLDTAQAHFDGLSHQIALQSNLFKVNDAQIDLLKAYDVGLGVSYDLQPGVRLTVDGRTSEAQVEQNIRRVRDAGIPLAVIIVIAKHTVDHLRRVYDYCAEKGMVVRILPLADGPPERPLESFSISVGETIRSMCDLFDYWFQSGLHVPIDPLRVYVQDAIRYLLGIPAEKYDRGLAGDYAFFVNVDGLLYAERDAYEVTLALGDLNTQRIADVLQSPSYRSSLVREADLIRSKCPSCPLDATCAGWPIVATKSRGQFDDPCAIAPAVIQHIVMRLESWGFGSDELRRMMDVHDGSAEYVQA